MSSTLWYKANYVYQIVQDFVIDISIKPEFDIGTEWVELTREGRLTIFRGYAFDGPSRPAIHTNNFMRGAATHDALYGLLREGWLDPECRDQADRELQRICREDGMSAVRAYWVYTGVRFGGGPAASKAGRAKPPLRAPALNLYQPSPTWPDQQGD